MKTKIFISLAVTGVAFLFYFSVPAFTGNEMKLKTEYPSAIQSSTRDTFTNCIFNASLNEVIKWGLRDNIHIARNLNRYKELNFNAVHSYDEIGSDAYGRVGDPLSLEQISNYRSFLDSVNNQGQLYGFFERSFLSKFCYGQRLIYEIPYKTGNTSNDTTTNYGFVYRNSYSGVYGSDAGRTVLHATPGLQNSGYLCKNIYENFQHGDLLEFRQKEKGMWFIKPVMRIPDNSLSSKKVVRIDVISFNGVLLDSVTITAGNFKNNGVYNGEYIDKYFDVKPELKISGGTNSKGLNYGHFDRFWKWDDSCKVDFRVYWYGECEVWFDRMIVDDEVANDLFNPLLKTEIDNRIKQEVSSFSNHGGMYTFFTDEVFISQYPCIKYVVDKMRESTPTPRFSLAVTKGGYMLGLKNESFNNKVFLDSIKPDFFQDDHHGFQSYLQKLPATITRFDTKVPLEWIAASNKDHNSTLQSKTLGSRTDVQENNVPGSLLSELVSAKRDVTLYSPTTKFIMQPQIHGWLWCNTVSGNYTSGSREPTNEEIQVQAMLSIAHGADGICWFIYNSRIDRDNNNVPVFYTIGMLDPVDGHSSRVSNCYGQNKWQYVSQMNAKINKWMNVLDNSDWVEGFSVHKEGANHNYINDIWSFYEENSGIVSECVKDNMMVDCDKERYWEMGFYNPKDKSDKSKYFLMVNRRCVPPTQSANGDVRILRIKFSPSQLEGSNNWIIEDINTGKKIQFDKNNQGANGYLSLGYEASSIGYFQPGEGKLFKLSPAL